PPPCAQSHGAPRRSCARLNQLGRLKDVSVGITLTNLVFLRLREGPTRSRLGVIHDDHQGHHSVSFPFSCWSCSLCPLEPRMRTKQNLVFLGPMAATPWALERLS